MGRILYLPDSIQSAFNSKSQSVTQSLATIGVHNISDYNSKILEAVNLSFKAANADAIQYVATIPYYNQSKINNSLGIIADNIKNEVLVYIILIPINKIASRSAYISQQLFPTLTNLMNERHSHRGNITTNKPILVINANDETYTALNALTIIATTKITGISYVDLYGRTPESALSQRRGTPVNYPLTTIRAFSNAVSTISNRSDAKFNYDDNTKTLELLQGNLKDSGSSMTLEVYSYLMQVLPAIHLASKEKTKIVDTQFKNWWSNYSLQKSNTNIEYFIAWLDKMKNNGGKTMQKIYFGSPGTGKSHDIEKILSQKVTSYDKQVFRTTFHPEYSYIDFIGQIMPSRVFNNSTNSYDITYDFYEGVFTCALKEAYSDFNKDIYFVIEEMSRGNVAAIFGDLFQLLDRFTEGTEKGWSKYGVRNDKIANQIPQIPNDEIKLPPNFHIFATVNTSDQNVFTMDTAFKRRFQWEYVLTTPVKNENIALPQNLGQKYLNNAIIKLNLMNGTEEVYWTNLYGTLNIYIADNRYLGLGEDKQIGQFFIDFTSLSDNEIKKEIQNKLLNYLWTDIANGRNSKNMPLFNPSIVSSFSSLYLAFENNKQIFSDEFVQAYRKWELNNL